jgi:hypothetical protein
MKFLRPFLLVILSCAAAANAMNNPMGKECSTRFTGPKRFKEFMEREPADKEGLQRFKEFVQRKHKEIKEEKAKPDDQKECINGSGVVKCQIKPLWENYTSLSIKDGIRVLLKPAQGNLTKSILVAGDDNILPYLKAKLDDEGRLTLKLSRFHTYKMLNRLKVTCFAQTLRVIELEGASSLRMSKKIWKGETLFSGDKLCITARGESKVTLRNVHFTKLATNGEDSAQIDIEGTGNVHTAKASGKSTVNARCFMADDVVATALGKAHLSVWAKNNLEIVAKDESYVEAIHKAEDSTIVKEEKDEHAQIKRVELT